MTDATSANEDQDQEAQSDTLRRTVRHAFVAWEDVPTKPGETFKQYRIMRGETYDFPRSVVERHEPLGSFEPVTGQAPPTFGEVLLTEDSSDAAFANFVVGARAVDLVRFVKTHPELADRINDALDTAAGTVTAPEGPTTADGVATSDGTQDPTGSAALAPANNPDGTPAGDYKDPGVIDPAQVVADGKVSDIVNYLADHPEQANAVLQAENERTDNNPRPGVVKAAEAAAAHLG